MNLKEAMFFAAYFRGVEHTTLNPEGPGNVRIHMIPPKFSFDTNPSVIILNGQDIIPVNKSWAILLANFIREVNYYEGKEIGKDDLRKIVKGTIEHTKKIYHKTPAETLQKDLKTIIEALCDVAYGNKPKIDIGYMTIGEYAPYMTAPHRMDLMISSMKKNGVWNCNNKCVHCYACGQTLADTTELTTEQWKKIIDKCRASRIPQLTFTGGEPTMRKDLVELVKYSEWFVTRLNTNGILLSKELCEKLYEASLDSVQITLYSHYKNKHNSLVGTPSFNHTVNGIVNAVKSGLNVSVNTPLCTVNKEYVETLSFLKTLGVTYVSCSGLIIAGNATTDKSKSMQLSEDELYGILQNACEFCEKNNMEIAFTSPGWIDEERLRALRLTVPSCGACLSNMAIAPNGKVIPCQSWLSGNVLGDMLENSWKSIWNNPICVKNRAFSAKMEQKCPLRTMNGGMRE